MFVNEVALQARAGNIAVSVEKPVNMNGLRNGRDECAGNFSGGLSFSGDDEERRCGALGVWAEGC